MISVHFIRTALDLLSTYSLLQILLFHKDLAVSLQGPELITAHGEYYLIDAAGKFSPWKAQNTVMLVLKVTNQRIQKRGSSLSNHTVNSDLWSHRKFLQMDPSDYYVTEWSDPLPRLLLL